jgi:hypothetical protein
MLPMIKASKNDSRRTGLASSIEVYSFVIFLEGLRAPIQDTQDPSGSSMENVDEAYRNERYS